MSHAWLVRPALVGDAVSMARVSVASWRAAYAGMVSEATLAHLSVEERALRWRERIASCEGVVLVAEEMGAIAGFAHFGDARDEDVDRARVGELRAIYVDPLLWGKRAGSALWAGAASGLRGRGFESFVLWVLTANQRARRFYEQHGMVWDGAEKAPVEDGVALPHVRYRMGLAGAVRAEQ